ncbi:MAG: putative transporter [Candidatus Xenolissoclinum pacificiensis L6]|uniref:Transporter n=1 Tax=Candidatus Xenolissoclinum pacificiensis L6 TaxID=1401685 RepID=W2V1Z5_9RICK|nr:MAG: putative transporter [Candidatus Xenolissoclinum pacificiensis L6]
MIRISVLYLNIILGFIAGKFAKVDNDNMLRFLFFVLSPIVIVKGISSITNFDALILPVIVFTMSCMTCYCINKAKPLFSDKSLNNIISFGTASSNTGHFGLPIALFLLDEHAVSIYILAFSGMTLFENTYGFYVISHGNFPVKYFFKRLLQLPTLYALVLGIIMSGFGIHFSSIYDDFFQHIRSSYIIIGMSSIGFGIARLKSIDFDFAYIMVIMLVKHFIWPLIMLILVYIDIHYFHIFVCDPDAYFVMLLLSVLPVSATTMIMGGLFKYPESKISIIILFNNLMAMVYIPTTIVYVFYPFIKKFIIVID